MKVSLGNTILLEPVAIAFGVIGFTDEKIKSTTRLLLESGCTKREIKGMKENSNLLGIELNYGVSDVGKRMLKTVIYNCSHTPLRVSLAY